MVNREWQADDSPFTIYLRGNTDVRFETISAFVIGFLLPLLETYRRAIGHWAVDFTTMFEDYVAGALLLIGGWTSYRRHRWGTLLQVVACAYVSGMMGGSFWYQLEDTLRGNAVEQNNSLVVTVKFLLWSIAVGSLILSFRTASTGLQRSDQRGEQTASFQMSAQTRSSLDLVS